MLSLGWAGLRSRPWPWVQLALGVAIAALLPVLAAGLGREAQLTAVRAAIAEIPEASRVVLAVTGADLRGPERAAADAGVAEGFAGAGLAPPQRLLAFRPLAVGGAEFTLAGGDVTAGAVELTSGRRPQTCTPTRCEVVALDPGAVDAAALTAPVLVRGAAELGVVVTGTGRLADARPVATGLLPADRPLLVAADPAAIAELASLEAFGRITAWLTPLAPEAVTTAGVPGFGAALASIADRANLGTGPLSVSWPEAEVAAAADRATAAAAGFPALGAGAAVLPLGFALVTAAGLRRRHLADARLLTRRGASPVQLAGTVAWPALLAGLAGLAAGCGVAAVVVALRAADAGADGAAAAAFALRAAAPAVVGLLGGALALVVAVCRWPADVARSTNLVLDSLTLAGAAATLWLVANGAPDRATAVLVALVVLTGLLAARLWPLAVRLAARTRAGAPVRVRGAVALSGQLRRPLLPRVTAGFVAAACCALVFAGSYRESLTQSAVDQAAAAVPLDVRITPSSTVAAPLPAVLAADLPRAVPGVGLHPVLSSTVKAFVGTPSVAALPLVGLDADTLAGMRQFAISSGGDLDGATLAERLRTPEAGAPGPEVPAGAREVAVRAEGMSSEITLNLWLRSADGLSQQVRLTGDGPELRGVLPAGGGGQVLQALEITESEIFGTRRQHAIGEGDTDRRLAGGRLRLSVPVVDGRPLAMDWSGWGSDTAQLGPAGRTLPVTYEIEDRRVVLSAGFVPRGDLAPLPVAVDPATAARTGAGGRLGLTVNGLTLPATIVTVLPRLPGVGDSFVLADRAAVAGLLDRAAPGTATVTQVWLSVPEGAQPQVRSALQDSGASAATITWAADVQRRIADDPVSVRTVGLVVLAGGVAMLLAVAAAAGLVRADRDEAAPDWFALELDGLPPPQLRRLLVLRAVSVLAVGAVVGLAGGALLAAVTTGLLVTGPGGVPVEPPLRVVLSAPAPALALAAGLLAALVAAVLTARTAYAGRLTEPELDLR